MFVYAVGHVERGDLPNCHSASLGFLKQWGLKVCPQSDLVQGVEGCLRYFLGLSEIRDSLPYDIDGVVYKVVDFALQEKLGFVSRPDVPR